VCLGLRLKEELLGIGRMFGKADVFDESVFEGRG